MSVIRTQPKPKTFIEPSYARARCALFDLVDPVLVGTLPNVTVVGCGVAIGVAIGVTVGVIGVALGVGVVLCTVVVTTGEFTTSPTKVHRPTKSDEKVR